MVAIKYNDIHLDRTSNFKKKFNLFLFMLNKLNYTYENKKNKHSYKWKKS